jgi:hypothetical protein
MATSGGGSSSRREPVKVTGIPFDIENPLDLAGGGLGGPHQALYDQANSSLDTFFADFEKVEMAERGGLGGLPFLVQVCGGGSHDKYIAAGGEQLDVEVDTGSGVARCTLKMPDYAGKSAGRGYVREGRDHAKYILARLPPALDPKRMPLTQRLLQAVRSGFGTQEQQELIAPSGYYNQNTNRFGWLPRRPFASFEGAPMANVPVSQDRWNMRGVVSAVAEVVSLTARVAGGFVDSVFQYAPVRVFGSGENDVGGRNWLGSAAQPTDIGGVAEEVEGSTRRSSRRSAAVAAAAPTCPNYTVPTNFEAANLPTFAGVADVKYGPPPAEAMEVADQQIAILQESILYIASHAPAGSCLHQAALDEQKAYVKLRAVYYADKILRNALSVTQWRKDYKEMRRAGLDRLLPGVKIEPTEPEVMAIVKEIRETAKTVGIETIYGPTGEAGCVLTLVMLESLCISVPYTQVFFSFAFPVQVLATAGYH